MFIVIVGAAVAGIIGVISVTTQSSADPMIHKQALAIAEAMMEEVRLQPFTYCDPDDPSAATASPGGPIAFRAAAPPAGTTTTTMPLTISKPAGTVQYDVMIASIGFRPNCCDTPAANYAIPPNGPSPPAGWTLLRRIDNAPGAGLPSNSLAVYWKVAGASEPASYQWTFSVSGGATFNAAAGGILTFSGVAAVAPVVGVEEKGAPTSFGTSHATLSIDTPAANTMLITSYGISNPGPNHWTMADTSLTWTEAFDTTAGDEAVAIYYAVKPAAGATGNIQANSAAGDIANAHILALKPAGCPVLAEAIGPEASENRYSSTLPFDNVNDYHGFDSNTAVPSGIRAIDGTLIAGLDGYRVTMSVTGQPLGGIGNDATGNPQSLLISVTVTGPGNTTVTLNGYRTRYAPNDLP